MYKIFADIVKTQNLPASKHSAQYD